MNFVGSNRQRKTLIEGDIDNESSYGEDFLPDWDSSFMEDAKPLTVGYPASFTWNSDFSSYPKGRLDYMIYTGSVLQKENSYVLFTRKMDFQTLDKFQLNSQDSDNASDHFPIVVDFSLKNYNAVDEVSANNRELFVRNYFPNPAKDNLTLKIISNSATNAKILVYDSFGKLVISDRQNLISGVNIIVLNTENLIDGVYFVKVFSNKNYGIKAIKFTIQK